MSTRALIIEDNQDMRQALGRFLENEGFKVQLVSSAEEAIDEVDENDFDIALIDLNLPGKSGFSMIEYIREQGIKMPLIALTAQDQVESKVRGFELGLTDYLVKPFSLKELVARIRVHLANAGPTNKTALVSTAHYTIDPEGMEFFANKKRVELTQLEFKIMHLLMNNQGALVKLDDLIEHVWGEQDDLITPPVRIHIANLRKKINDTNYEIIKTVPGTGYIFKDKL